MKDRETLEQERDALREQRFETDALERRISDELRRLEEAQSAGDRSLETVERIRHLGGEHVEAQRQGINTRRALDEVNGHLRRIGGSL